jgi:hypothetical protein
VVGGDGDARHPLRRVANRARTEARAPAGRAQAPPRIRGLNITLAASMGILLGFDKAYHFLPGFVLSNVFAHAIWPRSGGRR